MVWDQHVLYSHFMVQNTMGRALYYEDATNSRYPDAAKFLDADGKATSRFAPCALQSLVMEGSSVFGYLHAEGKAKHAPGIFSEMLFRNGRAFSLGGEGCFCRAQRPRRKWCSPCAPLPQRSPTCRPSTRSTTASRPST